MSSDYCVNVFKKILKKYPRDRLCNFVLINDNPCGRAIVIQNLRVFFGALFAKGDLLCSSSYNIIRVDRSSKMHPYDPKFPKKFRKNCGGVLIAHRTDIDISVSKLSLVSCQLNSYLLL